MRSPRSALALLPLALGLAQLTGCGSSPEPKAKNPVPAPAAKPVAEKPPPEPDPAPPLTCVAKEKLMELLAEGELPVPKEEGMKEAVAQASGSKDGTEAYGKAAPSVVIVRTNDGFGTGVVVDAKKGIVLTNYHVVRGGLQDDLTVKATVEFGKLNKSGGMERLGEKRHEAKLLKADKIRDLAVIRVADPPKDLAAIKVTGKDARPAEAVYSIGHAGIGMLWAVKGCQVSAVGPSETFARADLMDCAEMPTSSQDEVKSEECKSRAEMRDKVRTMIKSEHQGLVIQTDCAITGGDSGGPLVNASGELVGLTVSVRVDQRTGVSNAKHIHAAEIRGFLKEVPEKVAQMTPDPFCDGGVVPTLEDVDLDGRMDTLLTKNFSPDGRFAMMLDLDQDNFSGKAEKGAPYDAEVILLGVENDVFVYYDTDNDGRFDRLLVDKGRSGEPKTAFFVEADGSLRADTDTELDANLKPELLQDPAHRQRMTRVASTLQPGWLSFEAARETVSLRQLVPDPLSGGGKKGNMRDFDRDGTPDTVFLNATFSAGVLVDANQSSLGASMKEADLQRALNDKKVDAEFSVVEQQSNVWVQYDTDDDGNFDLLLYGRPRDGGAYATAAYAVPASGEPTPRPEHVGRSLYRSALLGANAARTQSIFQRAVSEFAKDEGAGSLPDPLEGGAISLRQLKAYPKAVLDVSGYGGSTVMLDADGNSFKPGAKMPDDLRAYARAGKFKPELALVRRGGLSWVYYDTDSDGKFDTFAFSRSFWSGRVDQGYKLGASGSLEPVAWEGRPIKPSLFAKKPLADKVKKLAKDVFSEGMIEG